MKSYRELTTRYLKNHKKRTLLTILGIILSVALLSAAGIMGESLQNTMLENLKQNFGNFHASLSGITEEQFNMLQNNIKVEKAGSQVNAAVDQLSKNQTLILTSYDKAAQDMLYISLDSGKMPENKNEIAVEKWVLDNMQSRPQIGDAITLDLNTAGRSEGIFRDNLNKEILKKEFKLTGILKNKDASQYSGTSNLVISLSTAKELMNNNDIKYNAIILIKNKYPIQSTIKEIQNSIGVKDTQVSQNNAVLAALRQNISQSNNNAVLMIELIAMAVIIAATIAVIYNAFHISVLERIHQFGVLRSIGTTPSQIRNIVFGEALILSAIGIPLGLLCGIAAVKGVIGIFTMRSMALFGKMTVVVPTNVLLGTAILGLVTVFLSAFGPAFTAGRVSPMEAILNTAKTNVNKLKRNKHHLLQKLFGIEAVMAQENLKRNRKRYIFTVFSIGLAVTLSIFFASFMGILNMGANSDTNFHKDFAIDRPFTESDLGFTLQDYNDVANTTGVKNIYRVMQKEIPVSINENELTGSFKSYLQSMKQDISKPYAIDSHLYGYRDSELELIQPHLIKGNIDSRQMNEENGVIISQTVKLNGNKVDASQYKVGDEIELMLPNPVKVKILGIMDRTPLLYNAEPDKFTVITTENVFNRLTGMDTFGRFDVQMNPSADLNAVKAKLQSISARVPQGRLLDFKSNMSNGLQSEVAIILYGIVAVISIIGVLNIINTVSTNIILRIREFGILRAIGMTMEQIRKMIRIEGIFYGVIGTFYGGLIGYILSRLMYNYFSKMRDISWHFPWLSLLIAGIVAVLTGILSSAVPLKRISRMDVVEAIRVEE